MIPPCIHVATLLVMAAFPRSLPWRHIELAQRVQEYRSMARYAARHEREEAEMASWFLKVSGMLHKPESADKAKRHIRERDRYAAMREKYERAERDLRTRDEQARPASR